MIAPIDITVKPQAAATLVLDRDELCFCPGHTSHGRSTARSSKELHQQIYPCCWMVCLSCSRSVDNPQHGAVARTAEASFFLHDTMSYHDDGSLVGASKWRDGEHRVCFVCASRFPERNGRRVHLRWLTKILFGRQFSRNKGRDMLCVDYEY